MEGYFSGGTRAARNNNPGNLRETARKIYPDLPRDAGGFIVFPSAEAGWQALRRDLAIKAGRGWSLSQIISAWAPETDGNDTAGYIRNVANWTGLDPSRPIGAAAPASPGALAVLLTESDTLLGAAAVVGVVSLALVLA